MKLRRWEHLANGWGRWVGFQVWERRGGAPFTLELRPVWGSLPERASVARTRRFIKWMNVSFYTKSRWLSAGIFLVRMWAEIHGVKRIPRDRKTQLHFLVLLLLKSRPALLTATANILACE